jgi:hypothetical protein
MPRFIFVYRTTATYIPSDETAAEWREWFSDVDSAIVDYGQQVLDRSLIGTCQDGTVLGSYSIVEARDLEMATRLARTF